MAAARRIRASKGHLVPPAKAMSHSAESRQKWLDAASEGFVQPTPANRRYYRAILERLWPPGHGIPGPHVTEDQIRAAIDTLRDGDGREPYKDVFRRVRELQGDEGFTSIIKEGKSYQLQSTEVGSKREPRIKLPERTWARVKARYGNRCAQCGSVEPDVIFSPDHKVPRTRGGSNAEDNFQPLCHGCNVQKSAACQGCDLNCSTCPWAYPETYKPLVVNDSNRELLRRLADRVGKSSSDVLNELLRQYFLGTGKAQKR